MADELTLGADSAPENTDTRSIIMAALEKQRSSATGETPDAPPVADEVRENEPDAAAVEAPALEHPKETRGRGPDGKFASKVSETPVTAENAATEAPKPDEATNSNHRPPPGWSPTAKAAFDALPPSVKDAIAKREEEVNKGFEKYAGVDKYAKMATDGGTTLANALEQYVGIEQALRRDVFAGIEAVLRNAGTNTREFVQQYLARNGGAAPQQAAAGNQAQTHQPVFDPDTIRQTAAQEARQYIETQETTREVNAFSSDPANRYFENVKPMMADLLLSGRATSLKDAYDMACWANPEIRTLLINEQSAKTVQPAAAPKPVAATQAKQTAKAIVGAPAPGFKPASKEQPALSTREILEKRIAEIRRASV